MYNDENVNSDTALGLGRATADLTQVQGDHPLSVNFTYEIEQQRSFQADFEALDRPDDERIDEGLPPAGPPENTFVFLNTQEYFDPGVYSHVPEGVDPSGILIGEVGVNTPQCYCNKTQRFPRWAINRKSFHVPETPLLHALYFGTEERSKEDLEALGVYELVLNETYTIVLQNYPNWYVMMLAMSTYFENPLALRMSSLCVRD